MRRRRRAADAVRHVRAEERGRGHRAAAAGGGEEHVYKHERSWIRELVNSQDVLVEEDDGAEWCEFVVEKEPRMLKSIIP